MQQPPVIMIVEDQVYIGEDLKDRLDAYQVIGPFTNGKAALDAPIPDLAILDIHLDGDLSGLDVAEQLNEHALVPVIFLTKVQDDQAIFNRISNFTFPYGYISKPVGSNELRISVKNALREVQEKNTQPEPEPASVLAEELLSVVKGKVLIRNGNAQYSVSIQEDIVFVQADGENTLLFTTLQELPLVVTTHLKDFLKRVAEHANNIVRTSRSNAVNIHKLKSIVDSHHNLTKSKTLLLEGTEEEITLSVRYRDNLIRRFHSL